MVVITLDQAAIRWAVCTAESSPTAALDRWLMQHPEAFRRIIIPAELFRSSVLRHSSDWK